MQTMGSTIGHTYRWIVSLNAPFILAACFFWIALAHSPARAQDADAAEAWLKEDRQSQTTDEGVGPAPWTTIALYPVNRLLDLLDIFQLDFGFGFGLHVNAHATRALQVGAGASSLSRVGLDGRQIGFYNENRSEFSLLPFSVEGYRRRPVILGNFDGFNSATERDQLYGNVRDYFGLGAAVTAGIVGVQVEARPTEMVDFLTGWAGIDLRNDDKPRRFTRDRIYRWNPNQRNSIKKLVLVSSRVVDSRRLGSETEKGVAVYNRRAVGEFYWGLPGRVMGGSEDAEDAKKINEGIYDIGYNLHEDLLDKFAQAYRTNMVTTEIIKIPYKEDLCVRKIVGDEIVSRLPNYAGLCKAQDADTLLDLRILEWSLVRKSPVGGMRIRLSVECKMMRYPENDVLFDISQQIYEVEKETNLDLPDFMAASSRETMIETRQAIDILVAKVIDRLME